MSSYQPQCNACGRVLDRTYYHATGTEFVHPCHCTTVTVLPIGQEESLRRRLVEAEHALELLKSKHKKLMNRLSRKVQRLRSRLRIYEPPVRKASFGRDDVPTKVVPGRLVEIVNTNEREEDEK
jgi:hypothetical protein